MDPEWTGSLPRKTQEKDKDLGNKGEREREREREREENCINSKNLNYL